MSVLAIAGRRMLAVLPALCAGLLLNACAHLMPTTPELSMAPLPGSDDVDPRRPVIVEARGLGGRLTRVEVREPSGRVLVGRLAPDRFQLNGPLAFGTTYRVAVFAENAAGTQHVRQELQFTTVAVPRLEGGNRLVPAADGAVTLRFDRPVGRVRTNGAAPVALQADAQRREFRFVPPPETAGQALTVKLNWETASGVPLPPLALDVAPEAAPAWQFTFDLNGRSNVGVAMPLTMTFTGTVPDREAATRHLTVRTAAGDLVAGRWSGAGERRLRFTPNAYWPASSTIEVAAGAGTARAAEGGAPDTAVLARFATGPDRRIAVYLDRQRVVAMEGGEVVRSFTVSTGKVATPTVTGSFYIYARYPLKTMKSDAKPGEPGYYVVENVPYAQYFHRDYALHGAWWHNGFGRPASHGCINLATRTRNKRWPNSPEDAGWLYEWATLGVPVTVYRTAPAASSGS